MTSAGKVELTRTYRFCGTCATGSHPADAALGVEGGVSPGGRRLMSSAASTSSFQQSADHLFEFCGIRVCDNTVREVALSEGRAMREWQRTASAPAQAFSAAGEVELAVDGTTVNTTDGWRELRLAVFAERPAGSPATPAQWDSRKLPEPTARVAFAGVWTSERFGPMWRAWAGRLGIREASRVTVLGDGARWIWKQADAELPGSTGVLDIYHASQHLYECGFALHGDGSPAGRAWAEARRKTLLESGSEAVRTELAAESRATRSPRRRAALERLSNYLEPHGGRTAIGSASPRAAASAADKWKADARRWAGGSSRPAPDGGCATSIA